MKIESYKYQSVEGGTENYQKTNFGNLNLLVGATGSGKSRLLNTIFNLGYFASGGIPLTSGDWEIVFTHEQRRYYWRLIISKKRQVIEETLQELDTYKNSRRKKNIIKRTPKTLKFMGKKVPINVNPTQISFSAIADKKTIDPIKNGFGQIVIRKFDLDELVKINAIFEFNEENNSNIDSMPKKDLFLINMPINYRLYFLNKDHPDLFKKLVSKYKEIFPFIEKAELIFRKVNVENLDKNGTAPIFRIKQKDIEEPILYPALSSGMQKVLLLLTDALTFPNDVVYLLDEYENSLGVNAIDFLPDIILEGEKRIQYFITSHHPYIINGIPRKDWYLLHRKGENINILSGKKLLKRYSRSNQESFIQLMNDKIYKGEE